MWGINISILRSYFFTCFAASLQKPNLHAAHLLDLDQGLLLRLARDQDLALR